MTGNRLAGETSPYLLQHAGNPVDWYPWGAEALAEARRSGRPILLSVGYAACHWCHVMAHESFEDPATAAVMNRLFVNIKVDREERPDLDQIYMAALHALGEQGGWPLTMFLTPAAEPIWGGTYFPPEPRYGRPAFADVLEEVARIFREAPERVEQNRAGLLERLRAERVAASVEPGEPLLDAAAERLHALIDPRWGGIAGAPKFPQTSLLEFLWRSARRTGRGAYADAVANTLRQMAQGGIYDHLAGGFARYSVDERWLVPHFEKMLYDNAQLLERLTYAWLASGDPLFRERVVETVAWLEREMSVGPAFASSLDADSVDGEGAFAVWTPAEVAAVLGPDEAALFGAVYDITADGNFEGRSIPNRLRAMTPRSEADEERLAAARARLLAVRAGRSQPARDDKVLADWNGLAIAALALAGFAMERPDWTARAETAFALIAGTMMADGRLRHSWRDGRLAPVGFASDYAGLIKAALALHTATGASRHLAEAVALAEAADRHHWDEGAGAYRLAATDADDLIARPLPLADEATPSPNGLMAANLVRLWRLTGQDRFRARVDRLLARHAGSVAQNVVGGASLLIAIDQRLMGADIVLVVPPGSSPGGLLGVIRERWSDGLTLAVHAGDEAPLPAGHPAHGKRALGGLPTAYVCRGETCSAPLTDPSELRELLSET